MITSRDCHRSPVVDATALRQRGVHPGARRVIHVLGLAAPRLAFLVVPPPIWKVQVGIRGGASAHARVIIVVIMLGTAIGQLRKEVGHRVVGHVLRLITVVNAASVAPLPVRIPLTEQRAE